MRVLWYGEGVVSLRPNSSYVTRLGGAYITYLTIATTKIITITINIYYAA